MTCAVTRLLAAVLTLAVVASACGDSDDSSSGSAPAVAEPVAAEPTGSHDHGEHHSHDTPIEVGEGLAVPAVTIRVQEDPASGWNLRADVSNFEIVPENASTAHIDGQGHMHLYINGEKVSRLYGPWHHIDSLSPGDNLIRVELSANDHSPLAVNGRIIDDSAVVTVAAEGDSSDHDHGHDSDHGHDHDHEHGSAGEATPWDAALADAVQTVAVDVVDGRVVGGTQRVSVELGSVVALLVTSDTDEEVHVHGYDILRAVTGDQPAHFAFNAGIPGVFEVELEGSGRLLRTLEVS